MAMPESTIAPDFNETLEIKVNLFPELTLNPVLPVNKLPETVNFLFGKFIYLGLRTDVSLSQDFPA